MRIAWIMQIHKNPDQVNRLVNCLTSDNDDVYIHCDKKYYPIVNDVNHRSNVFILPYKDCCKVTWGDFSQVQATINLIKTVIDSSRNYDYIFFVSGQCFLIKSIKDLKKLLELEHGEYIDIIEPEKVNKLDFPKRNDIAYPLCARNNAFFSKLIRKFLVVISGGKQKTFTLFQKKQIIPCYFGSALWGLSFECVKEIYRYIDSNPQIIRYFSNSLCPDESFFQSLFMQTSYTGKSKGSLWYIDWSQGLNSPKTLTSDDFENLLDCSKYIARKFDANVDSSILDLIERRL